MTATPNQALQRIVTAVTSAAPNHPRPTPDHEPTPPSNHPAPNHLRPQRSRQPRRSLSLRSLGTKTASSMSQPQQVFPAGQLLRCLHCQNDKFHTRRLLLNTRGMTFLRLDWLNEDAQTYVCARCGRVEWFADVPASAAQSAAEPTECLSCGATIPAGATHCPKCGWSYEEASREP